MPHTAPGRWAPQQFVHVLYMLRLRTAADREKLARLYAQHFTAPLEIRASIPWRLTPLQLQVA